MAMPEFASGFSTSGPKVTPVAFAEKDHPFVAVFAEIALEHKVSILIGSTGVTAPDGRIFNRSFMVGPDGEVKARYDKIHMFDVNLGKGKVVKESASIAPGNKAVLAPLMGEQIGMSICYDVRFAHLYRSLAQSGASMLAVPAAFMKLTGVAHWHVLNRARAIENGCFVFSPCQVGTMSGGAECYGHSLIVNPWGQVLADGGKDEGYIIADIDLAEVKAVRAKVPSLQHDRDFS